MKFLFPIICFYGWALVACKQEKIIFENYKDFQQGAWYYDSLVTFTFAVKDLSTPYLIAAYLRNTLSYPYYNIYVQYALRNAQGDTLKTATVEWMLMHSKTGYPFGKVAYPEGNGVGYYYDHLFPLFSNYQFPDTGIYHVSFKQYMRLDTLPHIHAIGLRIQKEN